MITPRYTITDNVDGQPSGYELVDTSTVPHCTFAVGLREESAVEIARRLNEGDKARRALRTFVAQLQDMKIEDDSVAMGGADTVDFICQQYPTLKAALE